MAQGTGSINCDYKDWEWSSNTREWARLLQSPSMETVPENRESKRNGLGAMSALRAVFIMVSTALGAGLLNFPAAFSMISSVATGITLQMVRGREGTVPCSTQGGEVVWAICRKVPYMLCEVAIAVYTFGICITFLIIIGDQEDKIIGALVTEPKKAGSSCWYTDCKFTISITAFLLILPLSIPKEISFQKYTRWVGRVLWAVIIIKYIWPNKELVPVEIPTSLGPNPSRVPSLHLGMPHVAARSSQVAALES
uniref:Sodium-coupled neutral amino acid transporter 7 n=1 Tax=Melopsittacus undulatus TaxID=13146 RepID=A0A8V5GQ63_MELUD